MNESNLESNITWSKGFKEFVPDKTLSSHGMIEQYLEFTAALSNKTCYTFRINGYLKGTSQDFNEKILKMGFGLAKTLLSNDETGNRWYVSNIASLALTFANNGFVSLEFVSCFKELGEQIVELCKNDLSPVDEKGNRGAVYCLTNSRTGVDLTNVGSAGVKLERTNYNDEVLQKYDFILKELKSKKPNGRLSIFQGVPGTGKTYLVRALLHDLHDDAVFIVIPPEYVPELASVSFLPVLLRAKQRFEEDMNIYEDQPLNRPLILVIEDADKLLAPRGIDNQNSISAILNLSDGILGSLLDLRIIATTNANMNEFDSAIIRPGRLCSAITVGQLSYERALEAYTRLTNTKDLPESKEGTYSLAEIYKMANPDIVIDLPLSAPPKKKAAMGF